MLVDYARLRDLTIVSVPASYDQWYAEAVIFGSGRPTLVLPESPRPRPFKLGTVAVAWDFSRTAARAVSDALPLLEKAKKVRIVTVVNEKKLDTKRSAAELAKNLARHGIDVVLDEIDAAGRGIGEVLEAYTASHGIDVLVMGAYGNSRWRQFILGGATKSLLSKPPLPIMITGYPDENILVKASSAGVRQVLLKPNLEENLVECVRSAIAGQRAADQT